MGRSIRFNCPGNRPDWGVVTEAVPASAGLNLWNEFVSCALTVLRPFLLLEGGKKGGLLQDAAGVEP